MAPVRVDPDAVREFASQAEFEAWLAANHDSKSELWLKLHKKGSGLPSVTNVEAIESALCWGWIDGIRKGFDESSFLQRFSPRKPKSIWSQINREHVERLVKAGRMTEHGLRHVEAAKADGRWDAAYAGAARMPFPDDLMAAIEAEPEALATFEQLNATNRYALAFRTHNARTAATRSKRIADFVAMLKRGEAIHPQARPAKGKA